MAFDIPRPLMRGRTLPGLSRPASGYQVLSRLLDLAERSGSVLDFGCGDRFAQAILAYDLPLTYCGIESRRSLIDWMNENVRDPRLTFVHYDAHNVRYSPEGAPISKLRSFGDLGEFDVILAQSVFTHMDPHEVDVSLHMLRQHVKHNGRLAFTYFLDETVDMFEDTDKDPMLLFHYNPRFMERLLEKNRWRLLKTEPPSDLLASVAVCAPV
jgi:SAM-dependent methyltransferase